MGNLDEVRDMQGKGVPETDIVGRMREQGVPPQQINDALNQSKIKDAVSDIGGEGMQGMEPSIMRPERAEQLPTEGSAPSDAELTPPPTQSRIPAAAQKRFGPMTQEMGAQAPYPQEGEYVPAPQEDYYAPQPQYSDAAPQEYYPSEETGYGSAGITDTMIEIS
jgi:hypothetical protein